MSESTGPSSTSNLLRHLTAVTANVRLSGTPEEALAFDYIGAQLSEFGYTVNRYEHDAYTGYPATASLTMIAPDHAKFPANGYSLSPVTPEAGVDGDLVDGGDGSAAAFAAIDIRGKIVITEGLATPGKSLDAARAGAIGHIHINGDQIYEMCISPVWGTPTPETAHLLPSVPAVAVTSDTGLALRDALARGPVRVNLSTQPYLGWSKLPVLTADLPGTENDTYVLFSGHVDSWHLGVMDNGTANATQLEVARLLSERRGDLRRGIRIAFWSGHSHARYAGSTWYADTFHDDIATRCVCHVNIDSVGAKGATVIHQAPSMAETFAFTRDVLKRTADTELDYHRMSRSSDQSFWGHGVPTVLAALSQQEENDTPSGRVHKALFGSGGLGWWWHTPEDTIDKIEPEFLKRDSDIYFETILELLSSERLPFEPAAGLLEMATALDAFERASGGTLVLSDLSMRARALAERAASANLESLAAPDADSLTSGLLRKIIPVNFTAHGPYDHDLALETEPLPGLSRSAQLATLNPDSTEFRFLHTRLVRERNRISGALREIDADLAAENL